MVDVICLGPCSLTSLQWLPAAFLWDRLPETPAGGVQEVISAALAGVQSGLFIAVLSLFQCLLQKGLCEYAGLQVAVSVRG